MSTETLVSHLGTSVTVDLCLKCQLFWFDARESVKLAPGAVLRLFRVIGECDRTARGATTSQPACPICQTRLLVTHDQQRNTKFQYRRCPRGHGRLISFVEFLREKDFIRPLTPGQIEELRRNVQTVNCSNCGAPIDLLTHTGCAHCGSPLSMLDLKQAGALVIALQEAEQESRATKATQAIDPLLPLRLAQARREVDKAFASLERWWGQ